MLSIPASDNQLTRMNDATNTEWETHRATGLQALRAYKFPAAIEEYRAALSTAESFGPGDARLVTSLRELANAYERDYWFGELAQVSGRLLGVLEQAYGSDSTELVSTLHQLARATEMLGDEEQAELLLHRALSIQERALGPDHPLVTWSLHALALFSLARKRFADAEAFWLRAEPIAVATGADRDSHALGQEAILDCLILVYRAWQQPQLMEATARRRLELAETEGDDDLKFGGLLRNLAEALVSQGRFAEASDAFRAAIVRYQRWFTNTLRAKRFRSSDTASSRASLRISGNLQVAWLRHELARVLREIGQTREADRAERQAELAQRRALAARDREPRPDNLGDVSLLAGLAAVYVARGKLQAAEPLYRRAIVINDQLAQKQIDRLPGEQYARGRARWTAVLASNTASLRSEHAAVLRALGPANDATLRPDAGRSSARPRK
jgi:tetratricopeptide (TPR) repeat protein